MASQWPVVHGRLVALLPTLPGWSGVPVYDGPPVTGDAPMRYVTVGFVNDEVSAGSFAHERAGNGFQVQETGNVRCELVTAIGTADLPEMRAAAFALLDALEVAIRADQTLGVLPAASTTSLEVDVIPTQSTSGAVQRLVFSVNYFTVT